MMEVATVRPATARITWVFRRTTLRKPTRIRILFLRPARRMMRKATPAKMKETVARLSSTNSRLLVPLLLHYLAAPHRQDAVDIWADGGIVCHHDQGQTPLAVELPQQ